MPDDEGARSPEGQGTGPPAGEGAGLRDEPPHLSGVGTAAGLGGLWGLMGYTVLWQGSPFSVDRGFVESVVGTLLLLPVRLVLWGIRAAEVLTGRTFDFADSNGWIGVVASALGAAIVLCLFLGGRAAWRRLAAGTS